MAGSNDSRALFEQAGLLHMSPEAGAQFERRDFERTYESFLGQMGGLLIGPRRYYEVPHMYTGGTEEVRLLTSPADKPGLRRISLAVLEVDPFEREMSELLSEPMSSTPRLFRRATLQDCTIDWTDPDRPKVTRAAVQEVGKKLGQPDAWRHDTRHPPFPEVVGDVPSQKVLVHTGEQYEYALSSSLPVAFVARTHILERLLEHQQHVSDTFMVDVPIENKPVDYKSPYTG